MTSPDTRPPDGQLAPAITEAVVAAFRQYVGQAPAKARTFLNENLVHVLLEDTMSTTERQLAATREEEFVLAIRRKFQQTMRNDLIAAVEQLGGRKVIAFMSDNHIDPDFSVEIFVLEPLPASPG